MLFKIKKSSLFIKEICYEIEGLMLCLKTINCKLGHAKEDRALSKIIKTKSFIFVRVSFYWLMIQKELALTDIKISYN